MKILNALTFNVRAKKSLHKKYINILRIFANFCQKNIEMSDFDCPNKFILKDR